ncbi:MAG: TIGR04552 family protein [Proteobacteria bacterium]|nr:TIGR04552 family protein [Pseudomonadota bacterium]
MANIRTVRPRVGRPLKIDSLSLADLEAIRLMLHGGSVIEWYQLDFHDHAEVDRFLRINEYDPDSVEEMARLEELRSDAVAYLNRVFHFSLPADVAYQVPARDLFLIASREGKHRRAACIVLKVMHIVNHLAGREAMVRLPIADGDVFRATELKVIQLVEELRAAGHPITEFEWSRKQRDSLITKLLAKRSTLAAKIYDKLRFRLIVSEYDDLMPMLAALARQLIPFNYVIPGESVNHLFSFERALTSSALLAPLEPALPREDIETDVSDSNPHINPFSGPDYRIINFVTDLPLRLESLVPEQEIPADCGHVVFVLAEFQIADKQTALDNERGESSHERYKQRQHAKVRTRLLCHPDNPGCEEELVGIEMELTDEFAVDKVAEALRVIDDMEVAPDSGTEGDG